MNKFYNELIQKLDKKDIIIDEPMKKHTSFKIGGNADYFIYVRNVEELIFIIDRLKENNINYYIVGNGTNLLVKDNGFRGAIIKLMFNEIKFTDNKITAGAGVSLGTLTRKAINKGIKGFENLGGIPGTIGGAVRMNAGAYGSEIKDILIETKYLDENRKIKIISNKEHNFKYRNSIFGGKNFIILESTFKVEYGNKEELMSILETNMKKRLSAQPLDKPNAGSTFKRGNGFITAKLIDEAGLKGYKIGGAEISEKHAGFVVNSNNAKAEDVINLIKYTKEKIKDKFNVDLETEMIVIGE